MKDNKCPDDKAGEILVCVCRLLQKGGTTQNASGTAKMTVGDTTVTLKTIKRACQNTDKITVRQLAKNMKSINYY